jgi:hypothetical protein
MAACGGCLIAEPSAHYLVLVIVKPIVPTLA